MTTFSEDGLSIIATKLDVVKNLNNPRRATRGVPVGPNVSFKYTKQIYIRVSNKNGASTSDEKKQAEVARQEYLIAERTNKIERHMIEGKLLLVDDDGKPLPKVISTVITDSDSEVEEVFDEHTTFVQSTVLKRGSDNGYGINNLWEQ
ncbi:hypothetical protein Tco_1252262 [Tanacetum coccineum]